MEDAAAPAAAAPPVKGTVIPARLLPNGVQFSIHEVPRAFARELAMVLPDVAQAGLLIVPTFQKAAMDLVNVGPDVAKEKDDLLEKVRAGAAAVDRRGEVACTGSSGASLGTLGAERMGASRVGGRWRRMALARVGRC